MFTVKTRTGDALEISPDALENQIVETSGEYKARKISDKQKVVSSKNKVSKPFKNTLGLNL